MTDRLFLSGVSQALDGRAGSRECVGTWLARDERPAKEYLESSD